MEDCSDATVCSLYINFDRVQKFMTLFPCFLLLFPWLDAHRHANLYEEKLQTFCAVTYSVLPCTLG